MHEPLDHFSPLTRYPDEPDEHPIFSDEDEANPTWEPAMGKVRGPLYRPGTTKHLHADAAAIPIKESHEGLLCGALPYLNTEVAGFILANPERAASAIASAQRNHDVPLPLPNLTLLHAVLAMRADFDRRIRQHAIPPRDGVLGRERYQLTEDRAAEVPQLLAAFDALVDALQTVLTDLGSRRDLRELIAEKLEAGQADRDALLGE